MQRPSTPYAAAIEAPRSTLVGPKRIGVGMAILLLIGAAYQLPIAELIDTAHAWVEALGPAGPIAFVGLYMLVTVLMLPGLVFTILAGMLFGPVWGALTAWLGAMLGCAAAFLIARRWGRQAVAHRLARCEGLAAIDRAIAVRGWRVVILLRLSSLVPFNVQNYLYGFTAVRFWPCVGATAVGILPGTLIFAYLGHAGRMTVQDVSYRQLTEVGWMGWSLLGVGMTFAILVILYIGWIARRALRKQLD